MKLRNLPAVLLALGMISCSENAKVAGTATDTENTIAGTVLLSDSSVAGGVRVRQVAARSGLSSYLETSTDASGAFAFDSTLADTVNVEFRYDAADSPEVELLRNVAAKSSESIRVRLRKPALLRGYLEYSGNSAFWMGSHFVVSLDSTTFAADLFAPDSFAIFAPEGSFLLTVAPADSGAVSKLKNGGFGDSAIFRRIGVSLSAGDTLDIGNLRWDLSGNEPMRVKLLRGVAVDKDGRPLKGVSVHVVTDLYGLGTSGSDGFVTQAVSGPNGEWSVFAPTMNAVSDSFRVEFRGKDSLGRTLSGVSSYIRAETLGAQSNVISVDTVRLGRSSNFFGKVFLVANGSGQAKSDTLCWTYGIRVGFFGTSNFRTVSSCDDVLMSELPPESQEFVFYSGDELVVNGLKTGKFKPVDYVKSVNVSLPAGDTLKRQGFTYTPPMAENGGF